MAQDSEQTGQQLHDTVQADGMQDMDVPPEVAEGLPEKYQEYSLADDAMNATVDASDTYFETLVDEKNEELYVLEMQDITWQQANKALTDNLKRQGGSGTLDFAGYYRQVAKMKIVDVKPEVPSDNVVQWLTGLTGNLGKQLEQHLPDPVADIEEAEEKN